jgi:hypothetical protein
MSETPSGRTAEAGAQAVSFRPGDEFWGVEAAALLPRLRLAPDASPVDLTQSSFTVFIDEVEYDVDPETAIVGDCQEILSVTDGDALGYVIDRYGDWWHHWAADAVDEYVYLPRAESEVAVNLLIERSGLQDLLQDAEWTWGTPE